MSWTLVGVAAGFAALTCGALSAASWRALLRTGNPMTWFFVVAFGLMGVKSAAKAAVSLLDLPESAALESVFSVADLLVVVLIAYPLVARRRAP